MTKIEMFFDYACPFCFKGFNRLMELLPNYPDIEMIWHLCEAHPRPEEGFGKHSDLCIQGMFFAKENGVDVLEYHKKMFEIYKKIDVEDIEEFSNALKELLDADKLMQALKSGKYIQALKDANDFAYGKSGVWVLPDFRCGGNKLAAAAGVGVTKEQIKEFLDSQV